MVRDRGRRLQPPGPPLRRSGAAGHPRPNLRRQSHRRRPYHARYGRRRPPRSTRRPGAASAPAAHARNRSAPTSNPPRTENPPPTSHYDDGSPILTTARRLKICQPLARTELGRKRALSVEDWAAGRRVNSSLGPACRSAPGLDDQLFSDLTAGPSIYPHHDLVA